MTVSLSLTLALQTKKKDYCLRKHDYAASVWRYRGARGFPNNFKNSLLTYIHCTNHVPITRKRSVMEFCLRQSDPVLVTILEKSMMKRDKSNLGESKFD